MAINIKQTDAKPAIKKIGVPQSLFDWLETSPFNAMIGPSGMDFYHPTMPTAIGHVDVTLSQLTALSAGTLAKIHHQKLQEDITSVLKKLQTHPLAGKASTTPKGAMALLLQKGKPMQKASDDLKKDLDHQTAISAWVQNGGSVTDYADKHNLSMDEVAAILAVMPDKQTSVYKPDTKVIEKTKVTSIASSATWPNYPLDELKTGKQVKLRDADKMYQPVLSTSEGSRYYLVAGRAGLRAAARYQKDGTLSVRLEGDALHTYKAAISAAGVSVNNEYASIHLSCPNPLTASKALGAILMGLGIPFETPLPHMQVIQEAS